MRTGTGSPSASGAHGQGLRSGAGRRPARSQRRRHRHAALEDQAPQHAQGILVGGQDVARDPAQEVDELGRLWIAPGSHSGAGHPARGAHGVENVTQQHQVDSFDRPIGVVGPPRRSGGQLVEAVGEDLERPGRDRLAGRAVAQVQIADDDEHGPGFLTPMCRCLPQGTQCAQRGVVADGTASAKQWHTGGALSGAWPGIGVGPYGS
jgi:hypothetical protein